MDASDVPKDSCVVVNYVTTNNQQTIPHTNPLVGDGKSSILVLIYTCLYHFAVRSDLNLALK
jgi:hypothetical protein